MIVIAAVAQQWKVFYDNEKEQETTKGPKTSEGGGGMKMSV